MRQSISDFNKYALLRSQSFEDENLKEAQRKLEIKSYILVGLSCIGFGLTNFHIKLTKHLFPDKFDPICFMIYRSMCIWLLGYLLSKKNDLEIIDPRNIQNKFWFAVRTIGNYFSFFTFIMCMMYFRASTASCINSMFPAVSIIFSIIILNEKFFNRYAYGLCVCIFGTLMIILNERTEVAHPQHALSPNHSDNFRFLYGSIYGLANVIIVGMLSVSIKIVIQENIHLHVQCYWVGLTNTLCGIIQLVLSGALLKLSLNYFLFSFINGALFYIASTILIEGYKNIQVSKTAPLSYLTTVTIFIFAAMVLGEPVFFTDFLGSALILGYNVYNAYYPPQK
jgi:drug/metabolite transporter (DMT)-like permease